MQSRARANEWIFRHAAGGREALAPPGEGGSHVHYQSSRRIGIGCITSSNQRLPTFFERLAYEMGITVTEAMQRWERGEIQ